MKTTKTAAIMMQNMNTTGEFWATVFVLSFLGLLLLLTYEFGILLYYRVKFLMKINSIDSAFEKEKKQYAEKLSERLRDLIDNENKESSAEAAIKTIKEFNSRIEEIEKELDKIDEEREKVKKKLFVLRFLV